MHTTDHEVTSPMANPQRNVTTLDPRRAVIAPSVTMRIVHELRSSLVPLGQPAQPFRVDDHFQENRVVLSSCFKAGCRKVVPQTSAADSGPFR